MHFSRTPDVGCFHDDSAKAPEFLDPYEVRIRFDWADPAVRSWFSSLMIEAKNREYAGKIQIRRPSSQEDR